MPFVKNITSIGPLPTPPTKLKTPESGPAQGRQRTKVSEALVIAEHLDDPLIANAKTKKDAIKAIKDKNKHFQRAKAVEAFDDMLSMTPEFDANLDDLLTPEDDNALPASKLPQHQLILGNFFDELEPSPTKTYDIILTDPPYGIDIHRRVRLILTYMSMTTLKITLMKLLASSHKSLSESLRMRHTSTSFVTYEDGRTLIKLFSQLVGTDGPVLLSGTRKYWIVC